MPSLRAWGQGSGAPAHRNLVQGPLLQGLRELDHALVTYLVVVEEERLRMAHETKRRSQERRMPSHKARGQGSGAPAYLQFVQGPAPHR